MKFCNRRREILAIRPSVLTYQLKYLNLYQHKQIHTNPTLVVGRLSVVCDLVPALWVCLNPCTRCATELDSFRGYWHNRSFVIIKSTGQNTCKQSVALCDVWQRWHHTINSSECSRHQQWLIKVQKLRIIW